MEKTSDRLNANELIRTNERDAAGLPQSNEPTVQESQGKTDLSRFDNSWYNPGSRLKIVLWFLVNAFFLNTYLPIPVRFKLAVLRLFGAKIGKGVMIKPAVNIKYPWLLRIGNYVWIGEQVWIDNLSEVSIGDNTCLSQGSMLLTGNHDYRRSTFDLTTRPITLADGVWIGAKSVVCAGVSCESHAVLAVNSVATRTLNAYGVYQGNPAVWVRQRTITT
ncbi:putative colanic acid biosynthesis acetyltransferase [Spirosoma flavus]